MNSSVLQRQVDSYTSLLMQEADLCSQDNKQRLKQVKNLEDLIKFKVKTTTMPTLPSEPEPVDPLQSLR